MEKILVAIENDLTLDRADYVKAFIRHYDGEVIEMTNFNRRSQSEIVETISKCTDIAVQTCFVNGSDNQLHDMVRLLSNMKNSINVYIAYIGIRYQNELREYLVDNLTPKQLLSIDQHNIYAMSRDWLEGVTEKEPHVLLDFSDVIGKLLKERSKKITHDLYIEHYRNTAINRPTGRKVKILCCTAFGKAFEGLPIGEEVDELECSELSSGGKPKGVWIMGNGEPIMLINGDGINEYELIAKMTINEVLEFIDRTTDVDLENAPVLVVKGVANLLADKELDNMSKANLICEEFDIPKRNNRSKINILLEKNLVL